MAATTSPVKFRESLPCARMKAAISIVATHDALTDQSAQLKLSESVVPGSSSNTTIPSL